jgi:hypothetical protein
LFKVGLQGSVLAAQVFQFELLSYVAKRNGKIDYTDYPTYETDNPGYNQSEDLDNVFTICSAFCSWVDVPDQCPPKPDASSYKHDKPQEDHPY